MMSGRRASMRSSSSDDTDVSTTLYFGNLHPFVQPSSLEDLCKYFGQVESAKVIKDKSKEKSAAGVSVDYGFVKFADRESAASALQCLNGAEYLGHNLRVNWALESSLKEETSHHVFVGDLGSDVTDACLYNAFCLMGQCSDARVMWDHNTGRSKGYGFVSFCRKADAEAAIQQMQGKLLGSRRIRVGWAQQKQDQGTSPLDLDKISRSPSSNTNVYVGNIAPETTEAELKKFFSAYGPVSDVKLHSKGGYGFVKYLLHDSAVKAIVGQHGKELNGKVLKCSWGKSTATATSPTLPALDLAAALQDMHLGSRPPGPAPRRFSTGSTQDAALAVQAAVAHAIAAAQAASVTNELQGLHLNAHNNAMLCSGLPVVPQAGQDYLALQQMMAMGQAAMIPKAMPAPQPMMSQADILSIAAQMVMMKNLQEQAEATALLLASLPGLSCAPFGGPGSMPAMGSTNFDMYCQDVSAGTAGSSSGGFDPALTAHLMMKHML